MASTALTRSFGTATNTQKFTISVWIKRSSLATSGYQHIWHTTDGSYDGYLRFRNSENQLQLNMGVASPNTPPNYRTNRVFRDVNAWYHIVVAVDTTLSTSSDRVKFYVNGIIETSFQSSDAPTQNNSYDYLSSSGLGYIGRNATSASNYFDGSMSHFHFIDGTAYDASAFGETDTTTGEWKAKTSPSVTYGNNGYFILKDGNSVTDQSGEGNNFTVASGTLTDLKDNPDNVFATLNPLNQISSVSYTNGNNTFTNSTGNANRLAFSTLAMTSGKFYCEMKVVNLGSAYTHIGLNNIGSYRLTNAYVNEPTNEKVSYLNDGRVFIHGGTLGYDGTTYTTGDIIGLACDMDNGYLYYHKNGTYINSGSPTSGATGTGGFDIYNHGSVDYCFAVSNSGDTSPPIISANFGNGFFGTTAITTNSGNGYSGAEGSSKFNYTVPTGYSALSTKGLNE